MFLKNPFIATIKITWNAQAAHWKWEQAIFIPSGLDLESIDPSCECRAPMLYKMQEISKSMSDAAQIMLECASFLIYL